MPHVFRKYEYLTLLDIERCPYVWGTPACGEWNREKDARDLITALERYAYSLICQHDIIVITSASGIYQKCIHCERYVTLYYQTGTGSAGDIW
jgi:hypothetical protein